VRSPSLGIRSIGQPPASSATVAGPPGAESSTGGTHLATSPGKRHPYLVGMKRTGFTLIELLIVVAIIGLVATIAVPKLINTKERALVAGMKSDLRNLVTAEENYLGDHGKYTTDMGPDYHYSAGNRPPTITLTGDGWTALMTNPNTTERCAVFVGSTPLSPATREAAPACAQGASTTTPPP